MFQSLKIGRTITDIFASPFAVTGSGLITSFGHSVDRGTATHQITGFCSIFEFIGLKRSIGTRQRTRFITGNRNGINNIKIAFLSGAAVFRSVNLSAFLIGIILIAATLLGGGFLAGSNGAKMCVEIVIRSRNTSSSKTAVFTQSNKLLST